MYLYYYLPLLLFALYVLTHRLLHKLQNLPPTPFPNLPLLGHLYLLKKPFHLSLYKLSHRYGPVFFFQFGSRRALIVSSPSAVEECFTKKNDVVFANRPRLLAGKHLGYNYTSLPWAPYGDHWRNLRRISSIELLSSHRLQLLSQIRVDEVRRLTRRLFRDMSDKFGRTVDLKSAFFELTYNGMMRMIAGKRYYGEDVTNTEEAMRFREMVSETTRLGAESAIGDFLPLMAVLRGIQVEKNLRELHVKRDKFMQGLIDGPRQLGFQYDDISSRGKETTMVEILLSLQQTDPEYYSDETIKALLTVLFQAGTDPSAVAMEWAMANLLNNPQVLKTAQTEIDNKVGQERLINESDLTELPYLECIINETLRIHPGTPLLMPHELSEDCTVGGFKIPRGTMLIVNLWALENDPKVWVDPGRFDPDRFMEGEVDKAKRGFNFIPFGSGRRGCPGERLGMRMVGLALGSLLQCFDWERVGEELVDMTAGSGTTVAKVTPLLTKYWPRPELASLLSQI